MTEEQIVERRQVRKRTRLTPRFFSLLLLCVLAVLLGNFLLNQNANQLPNLHGWTTSEVLAFANEHQIHIEFEYVFSDTVAPTLVSEQHVSPGTLIEENMVIVIAISKGVEIR